MSRGNPYGEGGAPRSHAEFDRLLPWYANGTLEEAERTAVEQHLSACDECRDELARCRAIATTMHEAGSVAPQPHPVQLARLMRRIDQQEVAARRRPRRGRWTATALAELFAATPRPLRWTFAAQLALVALLAFLLLRPSPRPPAAAFRTLAEPQGRGLDVTQAEAEGGVGVGARVASPAADSPGADTQGAGQLTLLRVVFTEDLPERELRELLLELRAEIVGGPSPFGVYTLAVPSSGTSAAPLDTLLEHLRERRGVQFAERAAGQP